VASIGRVALKNLTVDEEGIDGPEGITVVGIAAVAMKSLGQKFITIKIDGKEYSLFKNRELNVANALNLLDIDIKELIGQNGKDLRFTLNGGSEVVFGGFTDAAEIFINGHAVNLQTIIGDRDDISIYRAGHGADARAYVGDYLKGPGKIQVVIDGVPRTIESLCLLNDRPAVPEDEIKEGDRLEIKEVTTAGDILLSLGLPSQNILVNNRSVGPGYVIRENDEIQTTPPEPSVPVEEKSGMGRRAVILPKEEKIPTMRLGAADSHETEEKEAPDLSKKIIISVNGNIVSLSGKKEYYFLEALNHVEVNLNITTVPILTINGIPAGYTDLLSDGDVLEIILK
jgi:sulfur carrier protein ThiS